MIGHTPSPWRLESPNEGGRVLAMDDRETIVHSPPANPFNEQVMADARLIAAAPDLLGALKFILAFYEPGQKYLDTNAWTQAEASARRAVAKATGESA